MFKAASRLNLKHAPVPPVAQLKCTFHIHDILALESYLDGVEARVLLGDPGEPVETLQRGRRAARFEDEPPLGDEERGLAEDVGVHRRVLRRADDRALHLVQHGVQLESGE